MIPVKYNVRNLHVRWINTLMTVGATGLVVFATVLTFGFVDGLEHALRLSADPLDLIVLRNGSNDETSSTIEEQKARELANLPGIARDPSGKPMCSAEFVTILTKPRRNNGGTTNLIVRGLEDHGRALRPKFTIVEGRDVRPGLNEIITGPDMARRFENLAIGEMLEINKVNFKVVGYFEAGGSSAESEVWTDLRDLTSARRQAGSLMSVTIRATDRDTKQTLARTIREDDRFKLQALDEEAFFETQMSASILMKILGIMIAGFLTIGAVFAAANTMYAAVASRAREIGSLRAIGFSRRSVLVSFLLESMLLSLLGGILGCLAIVPLNGMSTGTANWATFSEITFEFRFGPQVMLAAIIMITLVGLMGGLFPAVRAVRMPIVAALREA